MVTRRQTFRLYPNKAQEKALFDARRLHCYLYNESALTYELLVAFDLGTQTALTLYDGEKFTEVTNPRFTQKAERQIKAKSKALHHKRASIGTSLTDCGCFSSTNWTGKRKHTGSMKQLGQMKRQKSNRKSDRVLETPSVFTAG